MKRVILFWLFTIIFKNTYSQTDRISDTPVKSGNPILKGWYADPEGIIFGNKYWIYPTYSDDYGQPDRSSEFTEQQLQAQKKTINKQYLKQTFFDAFSSEDLIKWEKHSHVLDIKDVKWASYSLWAPSIIKANNKYFLFFSANDIQNDQEYGGIGVAVSDNPGGPFKDYLGKPLINKFANGAQPIDQFIFQDQDGKYYLIYGGWRHCNIVQIKDDFTGLIPYPDGSIYKEITPENYVEGPFMFIRKGKYYLMWSEGNWTGPDYSVSYAMADSPFGPFKRVAKVLQQDESIARGAGHHSVINIPGTDDWYIVYHRRPLNETDGNHRETCIDRMYFDENGLIKPVKMTFEGVKQQRIPDARITLNKSEFLDPPNSSKVHTWWHWMGGNITKDGITKDLESMKANGVVQATIFNIGEIYTKKVDVPKVKFNSPEWVEMYQWALKEANRLGITIGIQTIDGFATVGGSWITPELSMKQYVWTKTSIDGGKEVNVKLEEPVRVEKFYRDEAVVAFPMKENTNSFKKASPEIDVNKVSSGTVLFDANPKSEIEFRKNHVVDIHFNSDFTANKLVLYPHLPFCWDLPLVDNGRIKLYFSLSTSNDGKTYTKVSDLEFVGVNKAVTVSFPESKAKYFRLELIKTSFVYFETLPIAEFELLKKDELPLFQSPVTSFMEKTSSVYDLNENALDSNTKNTIKPVSENSVIDITKYMSADGTLKWNAPKGRWQIIRFGYTSTGVKVDPASPEGLGLEVDKMDTAAVNVHLNSYAKKLIDAAGKYKGNTLKFLIMDSWEAQFQTWSKDFAAEFKSRIGYSILPWIPVLCGETVGSTELSEAFLFDFRKTIAGLIDQNFYKHFAELCHRNGMEYHGESVYGGWGAYPPMDALKSNEYIDLPMTEFWAGANSDNLPDYQPANRPATSMPTSSALAFNKQIIGSEAYTGNAHYSEAPGDLKPFGDAAFCSGVNQIILHSYVHQPFDLKPGMTLGKFGGHYNRNNPLWEFSRDWLKYQSRVQYVLQKGEPVADVLYYTGDQLPWFYTKNFVNDLPFGIQPNACNIDMLNTKIKVVDGKLSLGCKQHFHLLLLHNSTKMEFSTLKRIAELVKAGAVVYGPKPLEMLSVTDIKNDVAAFSKLAGEVWGNSTENSYGKGKMISGIPLSDVLKELNVIPDLTTNTQNPKEIMYIHKKLEDMDIYFVFNQQNRELNREILFRVTGKTPEIWNPENGSVSKPSVYSVEKNQTRIPVSFKPYESKIFVFRNITPINFIRKVSLAGREIFPLHNLSDTTFSIPHGEFNKGEFRFTSSSTGEYIFTSNDNNVIDTKLSQPEIADLSNSKIRIEFFPISDEVIKPVEVTALKSLTEFDDPAIRYFAGKAKYTINFNTPAFASGSDSILLYLGNLSATSEVILNGKLLAYPWQSNTSLDVTGMLKAENKLEITVANVCRNRFIGDLIQYGSVKSLWTTSPVETILNKDMPLKPSGLMGPVKLISFFRR